MKTDSPAPMERTDDRKTIWVFTPSRTDPRDLEFILVQREELLKDAVERVRESALTANKHHLLFVGPRGCGKTHLVTLIVSRVSDDKALGDRLRIAWLNEDETCTTLLEFLLKIHTALEKRYPHEYRAEALAPVYDLKQAAAEQFVSRQLLSILGSRTLLVVTENLDAIFEGLGDAGQKQLRAFIQENPKLSIVATAQRLVEDLSRRTSPFFGFFQTEHLKPLNVEEATELLQNIARLQGKDEVVEFLATSRGRSRVQALHHLSGGNHRIYIVLSQFITRDSIDALLGPFMKMVDELTPYYQERIRWLPLQQRKIVEYLCSCEGTVPVKEIAKRLFATPPTISSQLQDLREKGYVEANQRGRESLYEISEPLMRICVEVKDNQNHQPLRLLVDFLRVWYDDKQLNQHLDKIEAASESRVYLESAIQRNSVEGNLRRRLFLNELQSALPEKMPIAVRDNLLRDCENLPEAAVLAMNHWASGHTTKALQCLDEGIFEESDPTGKGGLLLLRSDLHSAQGDFGRAIEDYTAVIGLAGAPVEQVAMAFNNRGVTYGQMGEPQRAIEDYTAVIGLAGTPVEQVAMALNNRGVTYGQTGEPQREIEDYTVVIGLAGAPVEQVSKALLYRGVTYGQTGEPQRAIEGYTAMIRLPGAPVEQVAMALNNRGVTYGQTGEPQREIEDYTVVIGLAGAPVEQVSKALLYRGVTYGQTGEPQRAIEDCTAVIGLAGALVEQVAMALFNRGVAYGRVDDPQREIEDYTVVIGLAGAPVEQVSKALLYRGITYGQLGETQREMEDYKAVIRLPDAPVEQVARALFNRGATYSQMGETQRAIEDYTVMIGLPDAPVEQVARALFNRGVTYGRAGNPQRKMEDYTAVIGLPGTPVEQVAMALYNRGITFFKQSDWQKSQSDFENVLQLADAPVEQAVNASLALCEVHWIEGRWAEGFSALDKGLQRGAKEQPPHRASATDIIGVLFCAGLSPEGRESKVTDLLNLYARHLALPVLGEAVVEQIGKVFRTGEPWPSADNLEQWASAWERAAETVADFRLSVRLLRTGVDFVKTGGKNPGLLLDLSSPERAILQQALGLAEKDTYSEPRNG